MMTNIQSVLSYRFTAPEKLFFDASVWLPIFASHHYSPDSVGLYSNFYKVCLDAKCEIYIDTLIMSEFINTYARTEFNHAGGTLRYKNFKLYRASGEFTPIADAIAAACREMLKHSIRIGSGFETVNAKTLLDDYATGKFDFNDQMYVEICKANNLKLVTHDGDFKDSGLFILTANQTLLSSV